MKIAHYSKSLATQSAARRLQVAQEKAGVHAYSIVEEQPWGDIIKVPQSRAGRLYRTVQIKLEKILLQKIWQPCQNALWSSSSHGVPLHSAQSIMTPDILHMHWIADGALSLAGLKKLRLPLVWTIHDTWPFTGGCHVLLGCEKYKEQCSRCPIFQPGPYDIVQNNFLFKKKIYATQPFVAVSPSRLYKKKASDSELFKNIDIRHIPNCIDTDMFRPIEMKKARDLLRLPEKEVIILFGAMDVNAWHKGSDLLLEALKKIPALLQRKITCLVFGSGTIASEWSESFSTVHMGRVQDDITLTLLYSAADLFICPSREESFSLTTLEALACGTPVVAFPVGGIPDMITHGENGYLARPFEVEDLARGIELLLENAKMRLQWGLSGRERVEKEFSMPVIAAKYIKLYEEILSK